MSFLNKIFGGNQNNNHESQAQSMDGINLMPDANTESESAPASTGTMPQSGEINLADAAPVTQSGVEPAAPMPEIDANVTDDDLSDVQKQLGADVTGEGVEVVSDAAVGDQSQTAEIGFVGEGPEIPLSGEVQIEEPQPAPNQEPTEPTQQ